MVPTREERDGFVQTVRRVRETFFTSPTDRGMCGYDAMIGSVLAFKRWGRRLIFQAGTMSWRFLPAELDDGVSPNAYSYLWQGKDHPETKAAMALDILPEIHVWLGDPETQEVIDFGTGRFPVYAARMGFDWKGPLPPDYLWCHASEIPAEARYVPDRDASVYATNLWFGGHPFRDLVEGLERWSLQGKKL